MKLEIIKCKYGAEAVNLLQHFNKHSHYSRYVIFTIEKTDNPLPYTMNMEYIDPSKWQPIPFSTVQSDAASYLAGFKDGYDVAERESNVRSSFHNIKGGS